MASPQTSRDIPKYKKIMLGTGMTEIEVDELLSSKYFWEGVEIAKKHMEEISNELNK